VFLLQLTLWLGISALYLGFSGVMGVLLRRIWPIHRQTRYRDLAIVHGLLLFFPTSILILSYPEWSSLGRLALTGTGLTIAALSALQPAWIPKSVWQRAFGHRYFAATMALSALWGFTLSLTTQALVPILVAAAASLAGAASWHTTPRST
jgi:hypothetical protein